MLKHVPILLLLALAAHAGKSGSSLEVKHEFFWDRNGVWNHTPAFNLTMALSRKWSLLWEQELDVVSGASRRLGADNVGPFGGNDPDVVSGASKVEVRHSENPAIRYAHKGLAATGSLYYSNENDYTSLAPAVSVSHDFFQRNTTFGASYAEFFDNFRPQGAFASQGGRKRIQSTGLTMAQSLTSLTLVGVTGSLINSQGYLGHPYNPPVDTLGTLLLESVPDRKQAGAVSIQLVQGWTAARLGSLNADYRLYQDSWGIRSHTLDMKISQYFAEGAYIRLRGRLYRQNGAAFAKLKYGDKETYRTGDVRFFPFSSILVGAKVSMACPEAWGASLLLPERWDVKFDYMLRDTRGDQLGGTQGEPRSSLYQLYGPDEYYMQGVVMMGLEFDL